MDKRAASDALAEAGVLLELSGENPFRVRAYENAARAVRAFAGDLAAAVKDGSIREVRGIGPNIAHHLEELLASDSPPFLTELRSRFSPGVLDMLRVPGLGPKKVKALVETLGIRSVGELEYACRENRLVELRGFGAKTQENILKGIAGLSAYAGRSLAFYVQKEADVLAEALRAADPRARVEVAGSLRRRKETVKDIDLVATGNARRLMDALAASSLMAEVTARGDTKLSARLASGTNLDLRVVPAKSYPFALQHFTGSKEHNIALRARAQAMGLKSSEYGLFKGDRSLACRDEKALYAALGLAYIPPELREDAGEIEAAEKGPLPALVEPEDIKGALHVHTVASDGAATLEEMVLAAKALGLSYIGVTEHSQSAKYARGLSPEKVREEFALIESINGKTAGFSVLRGIESDILPDGSLDYGDVVLASFDFVIGSVHSSFTMPEREMTRRVRRALENPRLDILGHPTGRLLLSREPYAVDMDAVLACAAENGKAIEFNAHPHRLDIDWRLIRRAVGMGIRIAICPDAHSTEDLAYTFSGLYTARKGWLERKHVLNCMSAEELRAYFRNGSHAKAQDGMDAKKPGKSKQASRRIKDKGNRR